MTNWLIKNYYRLQIQLLVIFRPAVFFDKINQLGWYKSTLCQWVDDQSIVAGRKVLEVGCATGLLTAYIAKSGIVPTGVDASSGMIDLAKSNNNAIEFLVADALDLPFDTDYFDVVIAASLVNIVDDKIKVVSELTRNCRKGGVVTVLVPSDNFNDKDLISLQSSIGISGFSAAVMQAWHKTPPKMKPSEMIALFEQAGLVEITTKIYLQGLVFSVSAIKY